MKMHNEFENYPLTKYVCIVSPQEDFRLKIALLLSDTCAVELCEDLDSLFDVASQHRDVIAVVDSTLWRYCPLESIRTRGLSSLDHPVYVLRLYPYQLDEERVDDALVYQVDSIWMKRILTKKLGMNDFAESIYKPLAFERYKGNQRL